MLTPLRDVRLRCFVRFELQPLRRAQALVLKGQGTWGETGFVPQLSRTQENRRAHTQGWCTLSADARESDNESRCQYLPWRARSAPRPNVPQRCQPNLS